MNKAQAIQVVNRYNYDASTDISNGNLARYLARLIKLYNITPEEYNAGKVKVQLISSNVNPDIAKIRRAFDTVTRILEERGKTGAIIFH